MYITATHEHVIVFPTYIYLLITLCMYDVVSISTNIRASIIFFWNMWRTKIGLFILLQSCLFLRIIFVIYTIHMYSIKSFCNNKLMNALMASLFFWLILFFSCLRVKKNHPNTCESIYYWEYGVTHALPLIRVTCINVSISFLYKYLEEL